MSKPSPVMVRPFCLSRVTDVLYRSGHLGAREWTGAPACGFQPTDANAFGEAGQPSRRHRARPHESAAIAAAIAASTLPGAIW